MLCLGPVSTGRPKCCRAHFAFFIILQEVARGREFVFAFYGACVAQRLRGLTAAGYRIRSRCRNFYNGCGVLGILRSPLASICSKVSHGLRSRSWYPGDAPLVRACPYLSDQWNPARDCPLRTDCVEMCSSPKKGIELECRQTPSAPCHSMPDRHAEIKDISLLRTQI